MGNQADEQIHYILRITQKIKASEGSPIFPIVSRNWLSDFLPLAGCHFGQAKDPAIGYTVGGRGVDYFRAFFVGPGRGFHCCVVGQAEDGEVGFGDGGAPFPWVASFFIGQDREFDVDAGC